MLRNAKFFKTLPNSGQLSFYYGEIYNGDYNEDNVIRTDKTISYLLDCDFSNLEITKELAFYNVPEITINNLRDILWKNSLIKRGAFYLHNQLRIIAPNPVFDLATNTLKVTPFYCEMKIRYTINDVVNYFYSKLYQFNLKLVDRKADYQAVKYLMTKYNQIDYVEPLDIILCSIDSYTKNNPQCYKLIEISSDNYNVIKNIQADMLELEKQNMRQSIWR